MSKNPDGTGQIEHWMTKTKASLKQAPANTLVNPAQARQRLGPCNETLILQALAAHNAASSSILLWRTLKRKRRIGLEHDARMALLMQSLNLTGFRK